MGTFTIRTITSPAELVVLPGATIGVDERRPVEVDNGLLYSFQDTLTSKRKYP
jgi:hypothetical protein